MVSLKIAPSFPSLSSPLRPGPGALSPTPVCLPPARLSPAHSPRSSRGQVCETRKHQRGRAPPSPSHLGHLPCASRRSRPPRPFGTWPQPTFPPTARVSGSSYTGPTRRPHLPTGVWRPSLFTHVCLSLWAGGWGVRLTSTEQSLWVHSITARGTQESGSGGQTHLRTPPTRGEDHKSTRAPENTCRWRRPIL